MRIGGPRPAACALWDGRQSWHQGYVHCPPSNVDITLHVYTFKFKREHELRPAQVNAAEAAAQLKLGEQMGMKREQERKKGCTTGTVYDTFCSPFSCLKKNDMLDVTLWLFMMKKMKKTVDIDNSQQPLSEGPGELVPKVTMEVCSWD
ncbi:uncharacterized protein LOC100303780 [Zea mays]|uniref:Uncharacterized protein n=2 Tax=Zea mays TaxID=4577 RepID=B4FIZ2_MAIZE|nr:uncharacterized protein LOC100303780 [Zea mays]ACF82085.1 unknown [Zea mays]|eukprot:NP_001158892.1 uncharacterized protein LOC100303780 [Zea mays]